MKNLNLQWSGVVALGLILTAIVLLEILGEPGSSTRFIQAVLGGLGLGGAMLPTVMRRREPERREQRAPDLGVPPTSPRISGRRRRDAMRPPGPGAAGVLVLAILLPSVPALAACSPTQVQVHSEVGAGLQDSAREMRRVVVEYRTDRMRAAARAVFEAGGAEADAIAASRGEGERLEPLVEAQRLYALSVHSYVTAVLLADRRGEPILTATLPALRDLVDAYRHLRELGEALGVEELAGLPDTPRILDQYVSPQMLAQTAGGSR